MTTSPATLTSALLTVASMFHEPVEVVTSTGERQKKNTLAWSQKFILQGIADSCAALVRISERQMTELKDQIVREMRSHTQSEIDQRNLNRLLDRAERQQMQVTTAQAAFHSAVEAFEGCTGETYSAPAVRPKADPNQATGALERAAKMFGISLGEAANADGVEATPTVDHAAPKKAKR